MRWLRRFWDWLGEQRDGENLSDGPCRRCGVFVQSRRGTRTEQSKRFCSLDCADTWHAARGIPMHVGYTDNY